MSFFSGSAKSQASQQTAVSGLQLQSSVYGKALPIVYGGMRIAPNIIWYGDFVAIPQNSSGGGGGKGAAGGGSSGKNGGGSTSYTYQTAVALGLCEGPIKSLGSVYADKSVTDAASLGFSVFAGNYGQEPWGYLTSADPAQAIGYSGVSYIAATSYQLGTSPQLPNHNVEVYGVYSFSITGTNPDADPSLVVADLLTNPHYGAGLPMARLGDLSTYQSYCLASSLWISVAYTQQDQASSIFDDLATATNSEFVWSSGVLNLVPYGDEAISGNGYSYTAPSSPLFDLTDSDYLLQPSVDDPVLLTRLRPSDRVNTVQVECLDRNNSYNPAIVEAKDQALIDMVGVRTSSSSQRHMFADINAARISAQLELQRQAIRNTYSFTLDQRYVLLDPMDIVTLTDTTLGFDRQWVRITEITENDDSTLTVSAEEYLQGTGNAPLYGQEAGQGFTQDANADPGNVNQPVLFEPTAELTEALEIWVAVSGSPLWGGCDVWISNDAETYRLAGQINGPARTGLLTSSLASVTESTSGQTVDTVNIATVDLSESRGDLLSASQADVNTLATLCYVDGEFIAYRDAVLTGAHQYALGWLVRGAYGSAISTHGAGSAFARVDNGVLRIPYTSEAIGSTVYCKFVSFNIYGGGSQSLSDVEPFAYTIQGAAYASPPADVTDLGTAYIAGITQITWSEISDFRPVLYEVRKGTAWESAQILGQVAHSPFTAQGNGTYWVAAVCQPAAGIKAYSQNKEFITITGAQITSNVIAQWDEGASGWSGVMGGSAVLVGGIVRTSGSGNMLSDPDYLGTLSIFDYGFEGDGTYQIPSAHVIDIGRVAPCSVMINWSSIAQHFTDNILGVTDLLGYQDVLDFAASGNGSIYPEIALSQDGSTWGNWQKYTPGFYNAMAFTARMQLKALDPSIVAILQSFTFAVDVPDRDDHYVNLPLSASGSALLFTPDGASTPAAFNGGPQGSPLMPSVQVSILNAQSGDIVVISSVTLAGCNLQVKNAGAGVVRNVNVLVQGY